MSDDSERPILTMDGETRVTVEVDVEPALFAMASSDADPEGPTVEDYLIDRVDFDVRYFVNGEAVAGIYLEE